MKKTVLIPFLILLSTGLFALEVNKSELQKESEGTTIEFINYTGPHKVIDSINAIKGIGSSMGNIISSSIDQSNTTGNTDKYYVIHAVDTSAKDKLDADIIFLGKAAGVDHIVNLRRIISAYLSSAYGYSEQDADTLAVFITVYNAVYRSKLDSFNGKYKEVVTKNLSTENCGLSVNYEDWAGKSEIVIPLYDVTDGGLSTVDTSVISDSKVVESMQEDDDKNITSRKDMVDLKEREADESSEKAKASQKQAAVEQKKLETEKAKTAEAKKEAAEAQKTADEAKKVALENPENEEAQEAAQTAQQNADEKKAAAENQAIKEAEQKEKTENARAEAKEKQERADKKITETQSERKEIAKDQKEVQDKEAENAAAPYEYGIILSDETKLLSKLVKFNSNNGEIIKSSPVTVIRNRTVFNTGDSYIAIAGENKGKGAVKLILINPETLEISSESDNLIAQDSVLVQDETDFYCVIDEKETYYIGKFDSTLSLKLKSTITVKSSTPITVTPTGIVVTDTNGNLKLLDKKSLNDISSK